MLRRAMVSSALLGACVLSSCESGRTGSDAKVEVEQHGPRAEVYTVPHDTTQPGVYGSPPANDH